MPPLAVFHVFAEMDGVLICAIERFAGFITKIERIDRVFGQICAEARFA